jgi:hypothetical protein
MGCKFLVRHWISGKNLTQRTQRAQSVGKEASHSPFLFLISMQRFYPGQLGEEGLGDGGGGDAGVMQALAERGDVWDVSAKEGSGL